MPSGTKRIIFERPDGGITVDIPIVSIANDPQALIDWKDEMLVRNPTWVHRDTIEVSALPTRHNRTRPAWKWNVGSGVIEVDLPTSRTETMAQLRAERDRKLVDSDGPQMGVNEGGTAQQQTDWNTYRQSLRDLPVTVQAAVDAHTTAVQIEAYAISWPTIPV